MHGTVFVLTEKPEWLDENEVFDALSAEWPGIDYVDEDLSQEEASARIQSFVDDPNYPEFQSKSIVITSKSEHDRNQARKREIKVLSDRIIKEDTGEYLLQSLLEGEPYTFYICYVKGNYPCVLTLDTFLRKAEEGIYHIAGVMDYHC